MRVDMKMKGHVPKRGMVASFEWPTILWFFPAGRFALWSLSILGLALLCTFMPVASVTAGVGLVEALVLTYLLGWVLAELSELMSIEDFRLEAYFRDPFNVTDLLLIVAMMLTLAASAILFATPITPQLILGATRHTTPL